MGQSSNYKQYGRSTRILTEESGFAGGMLWTGNNIDETHLKAIVNFDYEDTTGYLKTRNPFVATQSEVDLSALVSEDLRNYTLIGAYSICAFEVEDDNENILDAHPLYLFAKPNTSESEITVPLSAENTVALYIVSSEEVYVCDTSNLDLELKSVTLQQVLQPYDNYLYGLGVSHKDGESEAWLHVLRVIRNTVDEDTVSYSLEPLSYLNYVKPKIEQVTLLEAALSGFNAARCEDTFIYNGTRGAEITPELLGVYMLDEQGSIIVSPRTGQNVFFTIPADMSDALVTANAVLALYQLKDTSDNSEAVWEYVKSVAYNTDTNVFQIPHKLQKKETTFAFVLYPDTNVDQDNKFKEDAYAENSVDRIMPYIVTANQGSENVKLKHYDLRQANGSCVWKHRMCVWGNSYNSNSLFLSEVDNFYYYPIPNGVAIFDSNIINCIPYKDTLLVFTANKIWRVSENNDGSFSQMVVQNEMPLDKKDSVHLTAIKNMVLFKSGNYFYMIVPKTQSLTDELSVAPIYKNIAGLLNTLDKSTQEVLQLMYPEYQFIDCYITDNPTDVYAEQDTIHLMYDVTATICKTASVDGVTQRVNNIVKYKLFLNYNTNLRAWTLYIVDVTDETLAPASLTAARMMSFVSISANNVFNVVTQQHSSDLENSFRTLLDTGYRTLSTATQKRFREIQLKLYSDSENITAFGTAFLVDGIWRRSYTKLQEAYIAATEDNYISVNSNKADNVVSLVPEMDLNTFISELSAPIDSNGNVIREPGSDAIELSDWKLDFSHFKREAPVTVRIPVSGKGYNPRFIFMAPSALNISINEVNWVYRLMHGR